MTFELHPIHRMLLVGMGALIIILQTGTMFSYDFELRGIGWFLAYAAGLAMIVLGTPGRKQRRLSHLPLAASPVWRLLAFIGAFKRNDRPVDAQDMRLKLFMGALAAMGQQVITHAEINGLTPVGKKSPRPMAGALYYAYTLLQISLLQAERSSSKVALFREKMGGTVADIVVETIITLEYRTYNEAKGSIALAVTLGEISARSDVRRRTEVYKTVSFLHEIASKVFSNLEEDKPQPYLAVYEFIAPYFGGHTDAIALEARFAPVTEQAKLIANNVIRGIYGKAEH